jgi:hypothetical protein
MNRSLSSPLAGLALLLSLSLAGCPGCAGTQEPPPDAGGQGEADAGEVDSGTADAGAEPDGGTPDDAGTADAGEHDAGIPVSECTLEGQACHQGVEPCCQGTVCSPEGTCQKPGACRVGGQSCSNNTDCCTFRCEAGVCSALQCKDNGVACGSNGECCTANCAGGTCAAIPGAGACKVMGQACTSGTQCCSTNCQGGFCVAAYLGCRANNELCFGDAHCCSGACSKNDGSAGFCRAPSGGCIQDGLPCSSGTNCCSRVCSDPGTGATVCLPASGCRMTGNTCIDNQACCGGGTNPNGSVTCVYTLSQDFGRCDNGTSCNPVGNICGAKFPLPDGGTFSVNASQNCCDGKSAVCQLDSSGIPRCRGCPPDKLQANGTCLCPNGYDGTPGCCIEEGKLCQFKDQCCSGMPCVPDSMGILRCTQGCVPLGSTCTPGGATACCQGDCLPHGEFGYVCQNPDAGTCKATGETCTTATECCGGACTNGLCGTTMPPCQKQGEVCTTNGDCCEMTSCQNGTCQPSTCPLNGQACSTTNPCCANSSLQCVKTANPGQLCDAATTSCVCNVIIG